MLTPTQRCEMIKLALDLDSLQKTVGDYKPFNQDNQWKNVGIGGLAGAGIGLLTGLGKDENGERHILRNILLGGAAGAGIGGATGAVGRDLGAQAGQEVGRAKGGPFGELVGLAGAGGGRQAAQGLDIAGLVTALREQFADKIHPPTTILSDSPSGETSTQIDRKGNRTSQFTPFPSGQ